MTDEDSRAFDDRRLVDELCVAANQQSGDWAILREEILARLARLREKVVDVDASHPSPTCTGCRRPREGEHRPGCVVGRCEVELALKEAS